MGIDSSYESPSEHRHAEGRFARVLGWLSASLGLSYALIPEDAKTNLDKMKDGTRSN